MRELKLRKFTKDIRRGTYTVYFSPEHKAVFNSKRETAAYLATKSKQFTENARQLFECYTAIVSVTDRYRYDFSHYQFYAEYARMKEGISGRFDFVFWRFWAGCPSTLTNIFLNLTNEIIELVQYCARHLKKIKYTGFEYSLENNLIQVVQIQAQILTLKPVSRQIYQTPIPFNQSPIQTLQIA